MTDRPQLGFVSPGERMPPVVGVCPGGRFYKLDAQAGRNAVFVVGSGVDPAALRRVALPFAGAADEFARREADVVVLTDGDAARELGPDLRERGILVVDAGSGLRCMPISAVGETVVLVMDRNLRVAGRLASGAIAHPTRANPDVRADPDALANPDVRASLDVLDSLATEAPRDVRLPAPVLVLPNLLPPELCRALIERFERQPSLEGAVSAVGVDGLPYAKLDHDTKRRQDHLVAPPDPLHALLQETLLRHCAPEIAKAFQARITHIDRILLARYDEAIGRFCRHRDNTAAEVAFREFAISVNLNAGAFEGGHLSFPEFNDHRYSPPTGGGLIFSASLLHEVALVTRGSRYVLLTFLHGDAAEARRIAARVRAAGLYDVARGDDGGGDVGAAG